MAQKLRGSRRGAAVSPIISILLIAGIVAGGYFLGQYLGWWGAAPAVVTPAAPTNYQLVYHDYLDASNDDEIDDAAVANWYSYDFSELDAEDVDDTLDELVFADFTDEGAGDDLTPENGSVYLCKINGTDLVDIWYSTDSRIFENLLPILALGVNDIYLMNATEDVSILCYDTNSMTTTINQTNYDDWTIVMNCLDASEGVAAVVDENQGYLPYYDPSLAEDISVVIEIQFNTTAVLTWGDLESSYANREKASGVYLYIEVDIVLFGTHSVEIEFGSTLGTDFEVIGIVVSNGYAESNTNWDTQN